MMNGAGRRLKMTLDRRMLLGSAAMAGLAGALGFWRPDVAEAARPAGPYKLSDAQWRERLSPFAYQVLREAATERPYTSPLNDEHRKGKFHCAGCNWPLYDAATKFDSGTGWPSFYRPLPKAIGTSKDYDLGYARVEVHCANCGGHLGHVFEDGPKPTGLRYCMNGVALRFRPT
jgi:peptide-methionine (R)-S-oxide reductase